MPASSQNCSWIQARIEAYVDGELHGDELSAVEGHLAACDSCSRELDLARSLVNELRALPALECPETVAEEAAARAGAYPGQRESTNKWFDRLRGRLGGISVLVPRPAMAAVIVVIVAATVFVLTQHEQSPLKIGQNGSELTEKDVELAKLDVQLAFAYLGKYSRRTGEIIRKDIIAERVMKPVGKTIVDPIYPFPRDE